jgi:cysteine desulfurase/selenocysteine lyase
MNISDFKLLFQTSKPASNAVPWIHLNNAGVGLLPDVYVQTAKHWLDRYAHEGAHCALKMFENGESTRERLANLLGAQTDEVGFFVTTASALSQAAFGIDLRAGDEILTWDQEYPSNFYPWRIAAERAKAKVIQVESENWQTPAQKIIDRVTSKTKVIAVSWVQYQTGAVTDLKLLSEKLKGSAIWLVADIIQGAGVRPFHFQESGFDIVCGGSHKWLCSGFGAAYMLIKKNRLEELKPIEVGAMSFGTPDTPKNFTIQLKENASRFEAGSRAIIEYLAMNETLSLIQSHGVQNIFNEACRIANFMREGLKELQAPILSGSSEGERPRQNEGPLQECEPIQYVGSSHGEGPIVTFLAPPNKQIDDIATQLSQAKVSFARRANGIRLSFHAYNTEDDVKTALAAIARA